MFQSTRPVWGATRYILEYKSGIEVSIHAPRVGRDMVSTPSVSVVVMFQSTRPMRGATVCHVGISFFLGFQSTRPMRGATILNDGQALVTDVSIHAPHVGRDFISSPFC